MRRIEQHQEIPFSPKLTDAKGRLITGIMNVVNPLFIRPAVENILVKTDTEYAFDFGDHYIRAIQDGYTRPVVVSNHRAIIDAVFPVNVAELLKNVANDHLPPDNQLRGFALTLAASLHYGQQGPMRTGVYNGLATTFERRNIVPFLTVRPQDVKRYKMKPYWNPRQEQEDATKAIQDGYGILIQPEGTTVGDAMNPFMLNALFGVIKTIEDAGEKALIIPVSKIGGDKIERRDKLPTLLAITSGLNLNTDHFTSAYVGDPLKYDHGELGELYRSGKKSDINDLIGGLIASHLPPNERGAYAEFANAA